MSEAKHRLKIRALVGIAAIAIVFATILLVAAHQPQHSFAEQAQPAAAESCCEDAEAAQQETAGV